MVRIKPPVEIIKNPGKNKEAIQLYKPELAEKILNLYISGMSLNTISKQPEMPCYATLLRWIQNRSDFREEFEAARKARAVHLEEMALRAAEEAEQLDGKDRAALGRLKFDAYKWGAEVNDSQRFGKKTTVEGNPDRPITFTVVTGVPQKQTPIIDVTPEVLDEEKDSN